VVLASVFLGECPNLPSVSPERYLQQLQPVPLDERSYCLIQAASVELLTQLLQFGQGCLRDFHCSRRAHVVIEGQYTSSVV
jgi:hypothetical protein